MCREALKRVWSIMKEEQDPSLGGRRLMGGSDGESGSCFTHLVPHKRFWQLCQPMVLVSSNKNKLCLIQGIYLKYIAFSSGLSILFHLFICLCLCQYHTICSLYMLCNYFENKKRDSTTLFFFFKTDLDSYLQKGSHVSWWCVKSSSIVIILQYICIYQIIISYTLN